MSPFRIVFVHGYTASSQTDWYPNIAPKLKKLGVDFAIPDLPGEEHPHAIVIIHSKDDDSIPYEQGLEIARDLSAELLPYEGRNHFSEPENAEEIFRVLSEKLGFKTQSNVSRH